MVVEVSGVVQGPHGYLEVWECTQTEPALTYCSTSCFKGYHQNLFSTILCVLEMLRCPKLRGVCVHCSTQSCMYWGTLRHAGGEGSSCWAQSMSSRISLHTGPGIHYWEMIVQRLYFWRWEFSDTCDISISFSILRTRPICWGEVKSCEKKRTHLAWWGFSCFAALIYSKFYEDQK